MTADNTTGHSKVYEYKDIFSEAEDGSGDLILTIPEEWGFNVGDKVKIEAIDGSLRLSRAE